jgi:hypothetical protein
MLNMRVTQGVFAQYQPIYAEHRIATVPVDPNEKKPLVKHPHRFGLPGSRELARKPRFADANGIGFYPGKRNRVTVLDIDTSDEQVLRDALDRHGQSPLIVRTASGKFHAYFRHAGEPRRIRPFPGLPIDLLGEGGLIIAPPSKKTSGTYQIIQGTFDELDRLPPMRNPPHDAISTVSEIDRPDEIIREGQRNNNLFRECMRKAHGCHDLDELTDFARTMNACYAPPMTDAEVVKIACSAWRYTEHGENRFGQHGAYLSKDEVTRLMCNPHQLALTARVRAYEQPGAKFYMANGLAEKFGWARKKLAATRRLLLE